MRWLNDQAIWSLAIKGADALEAEEAEALVPYMLVTPNNSTIFERATSAQAAAFINGDDPVPETSLPQKREYTIRSCLEGCWSRVPQSSRKTLIKEMTRCASLLGDSDNVHKPWLLDAEELCSRVLDDISCAPTEEAATTEGHVLAWGGGEEARAVLVAPVKEASGEGGVFCTFRTNFQRGLFSQRALFYGLKVIKLGSGGAEVPRTLLITKEEGGGGSRGPSYSSIHAAKEALQKAWEDSAAEYSVQFSPGFVPLVFIFCQIIKAA